MFHGKQFFILNVENQSSNLRIIFVLFYSVTFACIRGGRPFKTKGCGLRNKATFKDDCPMEIKVKLTPDGEHLKITSLNENHNHTNDKEEFSLLPRQRKRNSEEQNAESISLSLNDKKRKCNSVDKNEGVKLLKNLKTKKFNFENLCRTCSCEGDLQSLFVEDQIRVADMLTEITDLKIMEGDQFPQNICTLCLDKLKNAYNFIKQCYKVRAEFEEHLSNSLDDSFTSIVDTSTGESIINDNEIKQEFVLHVDSEPDWNDGTKNEVSDSENEGKPKKKIYKRTLHECPVCSKKTQHLKEHMRSHTKEKPFKCELCDMEFSSRSNRSRHIKIHLNDRPHVCEICNRAFTIRHKLKTHMKTHSTETPFKCELCEKSFKHLSQLKLHTTITHQDSEQCSEILASIDTQRNFLCDLCGKSYLRKHVFEGHLRAHSGEKPFSCPVCGKMFSTSSLLCLHRKTHDEEKPFKCSYCDKHFRMKKLCRRHELIHTGEKPLKCDLCGKCFRQSGHLYRHKRSHTGEKPFACTICDKHFIVRDRLNAHIRVQHTGETPYACSICHKKFKDLKIMRRHEKKVHAAVK